MIPFVFALQVQISRCNRQLHPSESSLPEELTVHQDVGACLLDGMFLEIDCHTVLFSHFLTSQQQWVYHPFQCGNTFAWYEILPSTRLNRNAYPVDSRRYQIKQKNQPQRSSSHRKPLTTLTFAFTKLRWRKIRIVQQVIAKSS